MASIEESLDDLTKQRPIRQSAPAVGLFAPPPRSYTVRKSEEARAKAVQMRIAKRAEKKARSLATIAKRRQSRLQTLATRRAEAEQSKDDDNFESDEASIEGTPSPTPEEVEITHDENGRPLRKCKPTFEFLKSNRTYTRKVDNADKMREVRVRAAENRKRRRAAKRDRAALMRSKTHRALRAAALASLNNDESAESETYVPDSEANSTELV